MPPPQRKVPKVDRTVAVSADTAELIKHEPGVLDSLKRTLDHLRHSTTADYDHWTIAATRQDMHAKFSLLYTEIRSKLPNGKSKADFLERAQRVEKSLHDRLMRMQARWVQTRFTL